MAEVRSSWRTLWLALALVGCGSKVDAPALVDDGGSDTSDASAFDDADAAADTAPQDTTPPTPTTLDNVCSRWADAVCATPTKDCCTRRSIGYDEAGCRNAITSWCGALVNAVKSAQRTFNASEFDACAAAWRSLETTCSVPFVDYVKQYAPCEQLFPGTIGAGAACSNDTDCIAPVGGVAFCDKTAKVCSTAQIISNGGPCGYDPHALRLCDDGYYCPAQTGGTCKPVTPVGGACAGPNDVSCGLGFTCALSAAGSYQCAAGKPYSAQCTNGLQCASWTCSGASAGTPGTCTDPYAEMASPAVCQGVP